MSLLATKLYVPPVRRGQVSRLRLIEQMSDGLQRRLTLISAPAGFGKTTLLSEFAACCGRSAAWLALDEADNDPHRFLAYLVAALRSIEPDIGKGALSALQGPQAPPVVALLERLINQLASIPLPFVLILDDYHMIEAEAIHRAIAFLLEHQPLQMHLVLSTRTDPPLPIARLRGRGQLTELRQSDLQFTRDEAAEFLNEAMGLGLSTRDVTALASRTEGWIAGLQMAAVSLQGRDDPASFVHAFTGSHRHVLDYLMEEVFIRQPPAVQAFLLRTAILDRLTAPLCDELFDAGAGQPLRRDEVPAPTAPSLPRTLASSQEILEYLDRANLFVVPLDEERRWYRYHHLFSGLLRQRLRETQPDSAQELHRRASMWCEQQGLMAEAIGHSLATEDFDRALQLVERAAENAVMRSELATLQGWLEALPEERIRTRPLLCVYHTWALLLSGSTVDAAEARLQDAVDADVDGSIAGEVLALRALMATYQRKMRESAELSRRALELLPEDRLFFRSFIAGYLGYGALYSGDLVAARRGFEETVRLSERAGNMVSAALALTHLGDVSMMEGHVKEGRSYYEQALARAVDSEGQRQPIAGLALIGLGQLLSLDHRLDEASRHFTDGIELIDRWGRAGAIGGYLGLVRIRRSQGDMDAAREALQTAERVAAEFEAMTEDDAYVALEKAYLLLAEGELEAVSRWLEESGVDGEVSLYRREEDGSEAVPFNHLLRYLLLARWHLAEERPGEALGVLRPLRQMVETAGWTLYVVRILILEALALHRQGDTAEAMEPLARALALTQGEGFAHLFIDHGDPMAELLRHAASHGIAPKVASALLARFEPARGAPSRLPHSPAAASMVQPLVEPLTGRELEVLRLLSTTLSTAEIADRLFVSVSTVRSHTKNIYAKLNVHRRSEAAERARELSLI